MAKLSVDKALLKAKSHAKKGEIEEAQKLYAFVLRKYPKNERAQKGLSALNEVNSHIIDKGPSKRILNHVLILFNEGKLTEALEKVEGISKLYPDNFLVWQILGMIAAQMGRLDEAIFAFEKVISLHPASADAHNNIGNVFLAKGRLDDAIKAYSEAISLKPDYPEALNNKGNAFNLKGEKEEAIKSYNEAILLRPNYADAYKNKGNVSKEIGEFDDAIEAYNKAVFFSPNDTATYYNLCNTLNAHGELAEEIAVYNKIIAIDPDDSEARAQKLHQQAHICDWDEVKDDLTFLADLGIHKEDVPPFTLLALEDDPSRHRLRSENHANKKFSQNATINFVAPNQKSKRLRIGYFSADFHNHATMYLMAQVFTKHDKSNFEVLAFSYGINTQDEMRQRLVNDVDTFHDVSDMSDLEIIDLARKERLDIAVDLKGYTEGNRLALFAYGLAPVQISYLGYPGTLGTKFIDYIIADPIVIPEDKRPYYSEKIIYLPNAYQPTDNTRKISDKAITRAEMGLPDNGFVFCCFNNNYKISPKEFDIWMRLLGKVDDSVLWLFKSNRWAEQNLKREAERRGIVAERLIFAEKLPQAKHLARLKLADLFLDTFNYNAHTTASDALWADLPIVTKLGEGFAARVAGSLLSALDLPELTTNNETEYEKLALELATNREQLASIKQKLAINRSSKPLFNTELFTKHLEDGYQRAYQRYFEGKKAATIYVPE